MTTTHGLLIKNSVTWERSYPQIGMPVHYWDAMVDGKWFWKGRPGQKQKYENGGQVFISYHVGMVFGLLYLSIVEGI